MSSENPVFNDGNVTRHLTIDERWLYRFCLTTSLSGASGPKVSPQEVLRTVARLRKMVGAMRTKVMLIDASPADSFNAQLKREILELKEEEMIE